MVPFSFEKITRSAGLDASNAFPVSDAARATHESFESHLQRAPATTVDQPTRTQPQEGQPREKSASVSKESPRNESPQHEPSQSEPVRRDTAETQRDDGEVHIDEDAEAIAASETPAEVEEEAVDFDATSQSEAVPFAAVDGLSVAIQEVESDASPAADDVPDRVVADRPTVAPVSDQEAELAASSLATESEAPAREQVSSSAAESPAVTKVKRDRSNVVESANLKTPPPQVNPSVTNEETDSEELPGVAPVAEAKLPEGKPPQAGTTSQRHGQRLDVSPDQRSHETPDAATKLVAVDVSETAVENASEDSSRQRRHLRETDAPQPNGNTTPAETTTTTTGTPSRFAQHLLARTEDPHGRGLNITNADQARFVDRVARAVQATGERGGTLRLRLSPPELGSLTLEVKVQGGVVTARVEADTPAARSLLIENLPLLRERLAEHGMRVDQFDVDLSDRQAGGAPDGLQQNDQQHEHRPRADSTSLDEPDEPQANTSATTINHGDEQLNIIV